MLPPIGKYPLIQKCECQIEKMRSQIEFLFKIFAIRFKLFGIQILNAESIGFVNWRNLGLT